MGESGPNKWGKFICGPQCLQPITFTHIENVMRPNNFKFNTDLFYSIMNVSPSCQQKDKNKRKRCRKLQPLTVKITHNLSDGNSSIECEYLPIIADEVH